MNRPLIAIPGRVSPSADNVRGEAFASGQRYSRAIARAGAQPATLPPAEESFEHLADVLERFDGLVLHGGGDVHPGRYGEDPTAGELYGIVPEHDELELRLVRAALELDLPVLAICRGMQILNVACGGTLVQHIGTEDHWFALHPVDLAPDSRAAAAFATDRPAACHSVHHQALKDLGAGLCVVGHSEDGLVEAVEHEERSWVVGLQWHPEDTAATDPQQQAVFDAFVDRARSRRSA